MKRLNVVLGEDNNIEELEKYIDNVINNCENIQTSRIHAIEILNFQNVKVALAELRRLGKENYNIIRADETAYHKKLHLMYKRDL